MPKKYPWPTAGLQKYSERLKGFIHERCTCYPPLNEDLFEVPEFMVIDPIKRRPSKFKLCFADDFPYTRFRDNDDENERPICNCTICPLCVCNLDMRPFPHYVLNRDELPQWTQKGKIRFKKPTGVKPPAKKGSNPASVHIDESVREKENVEKPAVMAQNVEPEKTEEQAESKSHEVRKKISAFSFDDSPETFPFL